MWIRTGQKLICVDGHHVWVDPVRESEIHIGVIPIGFDSPKQAQAALDRIHEWLSAPWRAEDKEGNTLDASPNVLDLRKGKQDE